MIRKGGKAFHFGNQSVMNSFRKMIKSSVKISGSQSVNSLNNFHSFVRGSHRKVRMFEVLCSIGTKTFFDFFIKQIEKCPANLSGKKVMACKWSIAHGAYGMLHNIERPSILTSIVRSLKELRKAIQNKCFGLLTFPSGFHLFMHKKKWLGFQNFRIQWLG